MNKNPILVVEDDVELCNSPLVSLDRAGYAPVGCMDLREAIFKVKNQTYKCILLDINLGAASGEDLLDAIRNRKDSVNRTTPVLVISGVLDKPLLERIAKEIQGALVKPFSNQALFDQLSKLVR